VRFDTLLVQQGQRARSPAGDVVAPLHLATTFERAPAHFYARGENPTREGLEECLAALENAAFATVYASGQAAASTVLSLLAPGARVLASDDLYAGTHALFDLLPITVEYADLADRATAERALEGGADLVWIETPSNPLLKITDLEIVCDRAHAKGARVVVDNTLASPALQQPLRWADVSLYSTTKSIAGHLDALGGALVYDDEELHRHFVAYRTVAGNVPGSLECYLIRRGLKTLSLRVARQVESARALVGALRAARAVASVHYPADDAVAARQMSAPGSMISFEYRGDPKRLLAAVRVFAPAVSLGGVQSLIECPALMTHAALPVDRRPGARLVRLSVGIEDPDDLIADLHAALEAGR
jgi:cystathionine gamma-lyase